MIFLSDFNVIVYTTNPPCPKCKVLKKKLDEANIKYGVFDDVDEMIKMGFENVPMMKVDDELVLDFSEAIKWINNNKNGDIE